jgi:two-component system chemotaxis response regulator CheY
MKRTVLVVDDLAFVRKTLVQILTENHFEVVGEATDGVQAVQLYQKLKPALVTMDIVMPNMSGIDACRRITKSHKGAKVIVISAMGQESLIMEAINAGAKDYILKPFSADEIVKTCEHVLRASDEVTKRAKSI